MHSFRIDIREILPPKKMNTERGKMDAQVQESLFDSSRTVRNTDLKRPIQVVIWYPTSPSFNSKRSIYRDYYLLSVSQTNFKSPSENEQEASIERFISFLNSNGIPDSAAREWLSSPMSGTRDTDPGKGTFPLIIVAQGNFHSAYNQAVLSEYLASHGYVVATTPSASRIDGAMEGPEQVLQYATAQSNDLEEAITVTEKLFERNFDRIALVGHSFSARAAFLLTLNRKFDAFVSLDGGIANRQGKEWLDRVELDYSKWITPLMHIYQEGGSIVVPDFELIDSLVAAKPIIGRVDSIPHAGFTSLGFVAGTIPGFTIGEQTDDIGGRASEIVKATRLFLDAMLKDKETSINWSNDGRWEFIHFREVQYDLQD